MGNVNIESDLIINNKEVSHASPTTTLRSHLVSDLGGTTTVQTINSVKLVDTGGTERDSASITASDWTFSNVTNGKRASTTKIISITANYSISKVRLYAGTNMYFEYSLTTSMPVTSGSQITVNITIDVTLSLTHTSGGTSTGTYVTNLGAEIVLRRFITGEYRSKRINTIGLAYGGGVIQYVTGTVTTDSGNYRVTLNASLNPSSDITINEYDILTEDLYTVGGVTLQTITLSSGVTH
ncbi:MAG: hypothetical protein QW512_05335, partial [Thermofilaceae archaeon]